VPSSSDKRGLFGPGSVTWKVNSDPAMVVGGMRALLVQALNPLAMAGVDQHSDFRADPWGRFRRTGQFVMTATFGTRTDAEALGARVRRIHATVRGTDPVTGRSYDAGQPELLAWVHNVLAHSLVMAKRRYGGGLSRTDADRYLHEMVRMAELVGTPPDLVPTTMPDLEDYLRGAELVASPLAQKAKWAVLNPPLPLRLLPLWAALDTAAVGLLPARVRRLYRLPWFPPAAPAVRLAATAVFGTLELLLPASPERRKAEARLAA
jgi:uncharacterized protein (DUF2236 family)